MPLLCLRVSLLAATVLGVPGCMSSPAEQLAAINSNPSQNRKPSDATLKAQTSNTVADQSAIADQATEDADMLNAAPNAALDNAPANADTPVTDADVMVGRKNIAAVKSSIFA